MTQLIPPNYGIVDADSFYVMESVSGRPPQVYNPGEKSAEKQACLPVSGINQHLCALYSQDESMK